MFSIPSVVHSGLVITGIAKNLHTDTGSFEVQPDIEIIGNAHATVHLHGFVTDMRVALVGHGLDMLAS